jgi:transcriptional regulator with XRE-family HTH domain
MADMNKLRRERLAAGYDIESAAQAVGVTPAVLRSYECGRWRVPAVLRRHLKELYATGEILQSRPLRSDELEDGRMRGLQPEKLEAALDYAERLAEKKVGGFWTT